MYINICILIYYKIYITYTYVKNIASLSWKLIAKMPKSAHQPQLRRNHQLHGASEVVIVRTYQEDDYIMLCIYNIITIQWPFQDPKLEVPTIYKAYVRPM